MIPILYPKTTTDFSGNGVGLLKDTLKCKATEERNGAYELELQYPITGQWYADICDGAIIKAKANETSALQCFRVYKSSKPIKGIVTYLAEHISYDLNGMTLPGFSAVAATPAMAIKKALDNAVTPHSFEVWSDIATLNGTTIQKPCSIRALLGGQTGSILDVWGGEYEFDNFTVKLHKDRGADNGVTIAYGKNLKDLKQESNISSCYTHIMPYAIKKMQGTEGEEAAEEYIYLDGEKVIEVISAEVLGHTRVCPVDLSDEFGETEAITAERLRSKAIAFAVSCDFGKPKVNLSVSFVQLWQTEEYKNIAPLERVSLCDTVTVRFAELGVEAKAKVIKTVYDTLKERYDSVEIGDAKSNFADTVLKQSSEVAELTDFVKKGFATATKEFANAIRDATNLITGNSGGYVVLHPAEKPQEILILDAPTLAEAVHVWRWNSSGLGYSSTGYNGEYALAITIDGRIVADFITAGTLNGALLQADSVQATAISQGFKTEVKNEIDEVAGSIEQAFVAADGQLMSVIENMNAVISGDISVVEQNISALRQTVENLTLSFAAQYTGGINCIANSSGLNGVSDDWTYSGAVSTLQNDDTKSNTLSGSCYHLIAAKLEQEARIIPERPYTLTFKARKTDVRAWVKILCAGAEIEAMNNDVESGWVEYSLTFTAPGNALTLQIYAAEDGLQIADIMLAEGETKQRWTPAPNEIYTTDVKIDRKGIAISNTASETSTIINNVEFAVLHRDQKVITVNKDLTILKKSKVEEEFTVDKLRIMPAPGGVDFVLLD